MAFAFTFSDVTLWLAFITVVLLLSTLLTSEFGPGRGLLIDRERLRVLAVSTACLFLLMAAVTVYQILHS